MRRLPFVVAFALLAIFSAAPAFATMPPLTELPNPVDLDRCMAWGYTQAEEATFFWGQMPDGTSRPEVAHLRLTLYCLGDEIPAIVGVGTSAGATALYCAAHDGQPICTMPGAKMDNSRSQLPIYTDCRQTADFDPLHKNCRVNPPNGGSYRDDVPMTDTEFEGGIETEEE